MINKDVTFSVFGYAPVVLGTDGWDTVIDWNGQKVCDVYLFRGECGLAYGDIRNPVTQSLSGDVKITTQVGILVDEVLTIEYGQMLPYWLATPVLKVSNSDQAFYEYTLEGGPPMNKVDLAKGTKNKIWGPNPDPVNTEATGSDRVFSQRCPAAVTMLFNKEGSDQAIDAQRWVREQGLRGCSFYDSENGYAIWDALSDPDHLVGQGYASKTGGWSTLFSHSLPDGVTWKSSGLGVGSSAHMTIESLAYIAIFFRSWTAARIAGHTFQAVTSYMQADENWSSRCYGWYFKSAAQLAPIMKYLDMGHVVDSVEMCVGKLEERNWEGAPAPDQGWNGSYHLTYSELKLVLTPMGVPDDIIMEAAKSDASFFVAILISGLDTLLDLWDRYNVWPQSNLRNRIMAQYKYAVAFMVNHVGNYAYDIHQPLSTAWRRPDSGIWDDVGPKYRIAEGGDSQGTMFGVGIRFTVPAIYLAAKRLNKPEMLDLAQTILERTSDAEYWNTDNFTDYMLEAGWPVGEVLGWYHL